MSETPEGKLQTIIITNLNTRGSSRAAVKTCDGSKCDQVTPVTVTKNSTANYDNDLMSIEPTFAIKECTVENTMHQETFPGKKVEHNIAGCVKETTMSCEDKNGKNTGSFMVDTSRISSVPSDRQMPELQQLGVNVYSQEDFEAGVMSQLDQAAQEHERERLMKVLERERKEISEEIK